MKILGQAAAWMVVLRQSIPCVGASSSIRGATTQNNNVKKQEASTIILERYLKEDAQQKKDKGGKESNVPSDFPSDQPSETPSGSPTTNASFSPSDIPSYSPSDIPSRSEDPLLVIEFDNNFTSVVDDTVELYLGNLTDEGNETEIAWWWNETDDIAMLEDTSASSIPSESPTDRETTIEPQVVIERQQEDDTNLLPCYWRFLTGSLCTNDVNGDVIDAYHHQFVVSDGHCHYNDFLGYYRARCASAEPENGNPARIYLENVFCSDPDCSSCLQYGVVRPEIYTSHMCKYMHIPATSRNNVEFHFSFEFVGGCFENESCSRIEIAGHGSSN
ncbi:hypothetical protein IV203_010865 [Nitzschia inconspicua]|uniref:Uncharacterized protein n=1 Tax=Nitzschia inconspicua TaxID=303405 RepID=A0A9K3PL55_9STRA|nr:hypothetical protein IV203_010865 [Nitzschia inconspicua]